MTRVPTHGFPVGVPGYQSLGLLGQGASGQIFKARQRSTGQFVAIKIPSTPAARDPANRRRVHQRLHQETRVLALLQHIHVVRLIDKGLAREGVPFAVLEYVAGETLREFLQRQGKLSLPDTAGLMAQVLDALAFFHAHHIVHRDLKPENVMVVSSGTTLHAKVLDFGLASHRGEPQFTTGAEGTPAYCAPEQLRGEACGPATDIYAWALMFVECLSSRPSIQGSSLTEVLQRQMSMDAVPLPEELQDTPLGALLQQALQKDVQLRTSDAVQLYGDLARCLAHAAPPRRPSPVARSIPAAHAASGQALRATMDSLERPRPRTHAAPSRAILCLTLRLYPARDASLALSDLQDIREQQLRWCANAVQSGQGHGAGTLGDCMLFHFEQGPSSAQNLQQAAALAQDLCIRVQRRSRMLEVQHGVRLEISGSMHTATLQSQGELLDSYHAANVTLHLNSLAGPGTVLLSHRAHHELAGRVKMEAYARASETHPPEPEPVYRLAPATHP
ncbi:protein kinase [Acidovorax sp.]|jgi:serine/threonine protein kinase|uniref:protein kinase domain-containing protein n=1 Tax=Acidovorax sp. TaxID=1872122 RepID=UPI0025B9A5FD|nr:protein kinase [Acidovorax sp.]MCI5070291.1 protein kinase [Acidovorax sp.]